MTEINIKFANYKAKIVGTLVWAAFCLIIISFISFLFYGAFKGGWMKHVYKLFYLDLESNVPTWFSSIILFFTAALLLFIGWASRYQNRSFIAHWLFLGLTFLFLSVDETACFHERFNAYARNLDTAKNFLDVVPWIIPAAVFALFIFIAFISFLKHLPKKIAFLFILSGFIYVLGAIGFDCVSSVLYLKKGSANAFAGVMFEESAEMGGIILFIYTLLTYIEESMGRVSLAWGSDKHTI